MSEENKMTEENKKTIIAFIAGLLIGGLLVFIFAEPVANDGFMGDDNDRETEDERTGEDNDMETEEEDASTPDESTSIPDTTVSGGAINVDDQSAGNIVTLGSVEFPVAAGWIGVRDYENGQMTGLLGVSRFNTNEGLLPNSVRLLRATEAGKTYAVVFYSDNGDRQFSLATDVQLSGVMETFKAE